MGIVTAYIVIAVLAISIIVQGIFAFLQHKAAKRMINVLQNPYIEIKEHMYLDKAQVNNKWYMQKVFSHMHNKIGEQIMTRSLNKVDIIPDTKGRSTTVILTVWMIPPVIGYLSGTKDQPLSKS